MPGFEENAQAVYEIKYPSEQTFFRWYLIHLSISSGHIFQMAPKQSATLCIWILESIEA
jgi:hypothetical protein